MMKRLAALFFLAAVLAVGVAPSASADTKEATQYIENIAKEALNTISNSKLSKSKKQTKLDQLFKTSVDIPWVARFVLGRYWRQASAEQKTRYTQEYEKFLLTHYTSRFTDYTSGSFIITNTKDDGENEYTVSMELQGGKPNEPSVLVDYRVRREGKGFKIFDVIVEGVSLITTQRSEFAAVVSQHDIDYLIKQLKERALPSTHADAAK